MNTIRELLLHAIVTMDENVSHQQDNSMLLPRDQWNALRDDISQALVMIEKRELIADSDPPRRHHGHSHHGLHGYD